MENEWLLTSRERSEAMHGSTYSDMSATECIAQAQHAKTLKLLESKGMLRHRTYCDGCRKPYSICVGCINFPVGQCVEDCEVCALLREMGVGR